MLHHVDSDQVFRELVSLRTACNPKQNPQTLWKCLRRAVSRLRALLPDNLDLADGVSLARLEQLRLYLDNWDKTYGLSAESGEVDGSDELNRDAQRLVERFTPPDLPKDGPGEVREFWWKGKRFDLPPTPWKILAFVWGQEKQRATFADVGEHVWGNDCTSANIIQRHLSDINTKLVTTGILN